MTEIPTKLGFRADKYHQVMETAPPISTKKYIHRYIKFLAKKKDLKSELERSAILTLC